MLRLFSQRRRRLRRAARPLVLEPLETRQLLAVLVPLETAAQLSAQACIDGSCDSDTVPAGGSTTVEVDQLYRRYARTSVSGGLRSTSVADVSSNGYSAFWGENKNGSFSARTGQLRYLVEPEGDERVGAQVPIDLGAVASVSVCRGTVQSSFAAHYRVEDQPATTLLSKSFRLFYDDKDQSPQWCQEAPSNRADSEQRIMAVIGQTLEFDLTLSGTAALLENQNEFHPSRWGASGSTWYTLHNFDLSAESLKVDPASSRIEYAVRYHSSLNEGLPYQTVAAFYWSRGITAADVLGEPFTEVALGGKTPGLHEGLLDPDWWQTRPEGATHLLMVLDPADEVPEKFAYNDVLPLQLESCQIAGLTQKDADLPASKLDHLIPELAEAVSRFEQAVLAEPVSRFKQAVLAEPGSPTFKVTSGYRPYERQAHFWEIHERFVSLAAVPGVEKFTLQVTVNGQPRERPQLRMADTTSPTTAAAACKPLVDRINDEILTHGFLPNSKGNPAVNPPADSLHTRSPAEAVDIEITGLLEARIRELAARAGLWRPYDKDKVHFQLSTNPQVNLQARFVAPSGMNLMIVDPLGRKLGYDPDTGQFVNQIHHDAEYSGIGSEPHEIAIPFGSVIPGRYRVVGTVTGAAPTSISVQVSGEDPSEFLFDGQLRLDRAGSGGESEGHDVRNYEINLVAAGTLTFQNPFNALDVNADGQVAPNDVLLVINTINESGPQSLVEPDSGDPPRLMLDTSGDHFLASNDVLIIINYLNARAAGEGEQANSPTFTDFAALVSRGEPARLPGADILAEDEGHRSWLAETEAEPFAMLAVEDAREEEGEEDGTLKGVQRRGGEAWKELLEYLDDRSVDEEW